MTDPIRQRALWVVWTMLFVASLAAVVALNRSTARVRASGVNREDVARHGFRLEESAKRVGSISCTRRPRSTNVSSTSCRRSPRWARQSPSATSTVTGGKTSTSRTALRAASIGSIATRATEHSSTSLARWVWLTSTARAPACRWAPFGATSTTMATRTCSSTSTAGRSSFETTVAGASCECLNARACPPGSTPTPPSGGTTTPTGGSICFSRATGPRISISGT